MLGACVRAPLTEEFRACQARGHQGAFRARWRLHGSCRAAPAWTATISRATVLPRAIRARRQVAGRTATAAGPRERAARTEPVQVDSMREELRRAADRPARVATAQEAQPVPAPAPAA